MLGLISVYVLSYGVCARGLFDIAQAKCGKCHRHRTLKKCMPYVIFKTLNKLSVVWGLWNFIQRVSKRFCTVLCSIPYIYLWLCSHSEYTYRATVSTPSI